MKALWVLLICLLTVYAPIELTWVIIDHEFIHNLSAIPKWQFVAEMSIFWVFYMIGLIVIYRVTNKG